MLVFAWFPKVKWQLTYEKTDLYLLEYIQTEMSQSQIMPQKRNAVPEFDEVSRLVQCSIGHGYLWWRGLMTGGLREKTRYLPPPFKETLKIRK